MPLVSIIVDNYNYGRFLREAIDSALGQTYESMEVIVVDDGSTDGSREIIASYGSQVLPVLKENGGQASAFNAGFLASHGDLVMFLDSDDLLLNHAIERVVTCWKPEFAKMQFHLECVNANLKRLGIFYPNFRDPSPPTDVRPLLLRTGQYCCPPTSGNVFSRAALAAVFPVNESKYRISADGYVLTVTPFYGCVGCLREVLGLYRIHGANAWHHNSVSSGKLHFYIEHGFNKAEAACTTASKFGLKTPGKDALCLRQFSQTSTRLVSLRLNPKAHPVPADSPFKLAVHCLGSLWRWDDLMSRRRRMLWTAWCLWIAFLPVRLSRPLISWWSVPATFPRPLRKLLHRLT